MRFPTPKDTDEHQPAIRVPSKIPCFLVCFLYARSMEIKSVETLVTKCLQVGQSIQVLASFLTQFCFFTEAGHWIAKLEMPKGNIGTQKTRAFADGTYRLMARPSLWLEFWNRNNDWSKLLFI